MLGRISSDPPAASARPSYNPVMRSLRARMGVAALVLGGLPGPVGAPPPSETTLHAQGVHNVRLTARRYSFTPNRIEVTVGDLIKIELRTEDIAHSLTIDEYRLAKRVSPNHPVSLEFRAERAGAFPFYCNLQIDEGCRRMHGELVVKPRR